MGTEEKNTNERVHEDAPEAPAKPYSATAGIVSWALSVTGFAAAVSGLVLSKSQHFSWTLHEYARELQAMSFDSGTLILGGLSLMGLGIAIRSSSAAAKARHELREVRDQEPGAEQMSELDLTLRAVSRTVNTMHQKVEEISVRQQKAERDLAMQREESWHEKQGEALFRLAASLDDLGQRLMDGQEKLLEAVLEHTTGIADRIELGLAAREAELREAGAAHDDSVVVLDEARFEKAAPENEEMTVLVEVEDEFEDDWYAEAHDEPKALGLLDELDDGDQAAAQLELEPETLAELEVVYREMPEEPPAPFPAPLPGAVQSKVPPMQGPWLPGAEPTGESLESVMARRGSRR